MTGLNLGDDNTSFLGFLYVVAVESCDSCVKYETFAFVTIVNVLFYVNANLSVGVINNLDLYEFHAHVLFLSTFYFNYVSVRM